ncbi:MAG: hypothetical protein SF053_09590 [Bacteroidia bacterium]|nr:hypothetical protein [Bacteroidia bacterium]
MESVTSIPAAYEAYIHLHGKRPASVRAFVEAQSVTEADFYAEAGSFFALERKILRTHLDTTLERLAADPAYAGYGAREKALACMFTWLEVLTPQRTFVQVASTQEACLGLSPYLQALEEPIKAWARNLVRDGITSTEIADRLLVTQWYKDHIWAILYTVTGYWLRDQSANFADTDAFVEKTVNFYFDLVQPNSLDSGLDLLRFVFRIS